MKSRRLPKQRPVEETQEAREQRILSEIEKTDDEFRNAWNIALTTGLPISEVVRTAKAHRIELEEPAPHLYPTICDSILERLDNGEPINDIAREHGVYTKTVIAAARLSLGCGYGTAYSIPQNIKAEIAEVLKEWPIARDVAKALYISQGTITTIAGQNDQTLARKPRAKRLPRSGQISGVKSDSSESALGGQSFNQNDAKRSRRKKPRKVSTVGSTAIRRPRSSQLLTPEDVKGTLREWPILADVAKAARLDLPTVRLMAIEEDIPLSLERAAPTNRDWKRRTRIYSRSDVGGSCEQDVEDIPETKKFNVGSNNSYCMFRLAGKDLGVEPITNETMSGHSIASDEEVFEITTERKRGKVYGSRLSLQTKGL